VTNPRFLSLAFIIATLSLTACGGGGGGGSKPTAPSSQAAISSNSQVSSTTPVSSAISSAQLSSAQQSSASAPISSAVSSSLAPSSSAPAITSSAASSISSASQTSSTAQPSDFSFSLEDNDLQLWEGNYEHYFDLVFDKTEAVDRELYIDVVNTSTAEEGKDFELLQRELKVPADTNRASLGIKILDDEHFEANESIILRLSNGLFEKDITISLIDSTDKGRTHAALSESYYAPMATVQGNHLIVASTKAFERYNLSQEKTNFSAAFTFAIEGNFGDAVAYQGKTYVFTSGKLYELDFFNQYRLVSEAPWYIDWTGELQIHNDELWIITGRTSNSQDITHAAIYNFEYDTWRQGAEFTNFTPGHYGAATFTSNDILFYSLGRSIEKLLNDDTWETVTTIPNGFYFPRMSSAQLQGSRAVFLHNETTNTAIAGVYDLVNNTYKQVRLGIPASAHQDTVIYKGRIYVIGNSANTGVSNSVTSFYIGDDIDQY